MNDRELLEMAAKAAGLPMCEEWDCAADGDGILIGAGNGDLKPWNPLTDDGDALRLAHALGMQLNIDECNDMNDVRTDIVLAAAAIGSAM